MGNFASTLKGGDTLRSDQDLAVPRQPGLVLLYCCGRPVAKVLPFAGQPLELGRGVHGMDLDQRMSRRHARVTFDGRRFWVTDLSSQNGTHVDGKAIPANQATEAQRVIRMGDSLIGIFREIESLEEKGVRREGEMIAGPALQALLHEVKQAATFGGALHITGESGTGKELVAHTFHERGPRREGPFIPVNCAAIPQGLAERLFFGTRRGAYSGADANAEGYIQAAAGGTLFLDEVGDLDLNLQAKLLRVLETREFVPLGASRPQTVELQVCSATNKDLKLLVGSGRFRQDMYYRIGRPLVLIPPLRKRPEEIPWLVDSIVKKTSTSVSVHVSLVEACLLRPWPGNIRELLVEVRSATQSASFQGSGRVEARHLPEGAGTVLSVFADPGSSECSEPLSAPAAPKSVDPSELAKLEAALRQNHGNVSGTARQLGMHRTQLRRLLERYGLDPARFGSDEKQNLDPESL